MHAPGTDPDRILIAGDGTAAGRGVVTHDLGLSGYLARAVTALSGRATDVDVVVSSTITARDCLNAIADLEFARFDSVVLSVGGVEALDFAPPSRWERGLTALLNRVEEGTFASSITFVLSIPHFASHRAFPRSLARATDRHVNRLNIITRRVLSGRASTRYVVIGGTDSIEISDSHAYERWAASLAPHLRDALAPRTVDPRVEVLHESRRQNALDQLGVVDIRSDRILDGLTSRARSLFGTEIAAITLIDGPRQTMISVDGMRGADMARQEAFCDVTIRRAEHLAVEDAALDDRYSNLRIVNSGPKVRFYAGYPVESQDGERIGALCILDSAPRTFTKEDGALLRLLALETQKRIWELGSHEDGIATPPPRA